MVWEIALATVDESEQLLGDFMRLKYLSADGPIRRRVRLQCLLTTAIACAVHPAFAASLDQLEDTRAQIEMLRAEQARIEELHRQTEARLRALEARLGEQQSSPAASAPPAAVVSSTERSPLIVSGDLRLRAQGDYSDSDGRDRTSAQVRGRLGATYAMNDAVTLGARIVTGDPDDPNSTDVQLSNFDDDLQVSLDLAYVQVDVGDLKLYGGKIPQPFTRTDLVWDSDVNPQGASALYKRSLANGSTLRAGGLFFIVDEAAGGADSTMNGVQLGYDSADLGAWKFDVSAAYYDYRLGSVAGGDSGDFRSNLRAPDGSYTSDFNLGDLIVVATWAGLSERLPVRVIGDYVKNFGAATRDDTGYSVDVSVGRARNRGDWRITYGYSVAETDAVLAAFSHDNIGLGTDYRLHALTLDHVPLPKMLISAIWYHYEPYGSAGTSPRDVGDWLDRVRLAFLVSF